jgi:hypothetical protein
MNIAKTREFRKESPEEVAVLSYQPDGAFGLSIFTGSALPRVGN